MKFSTMESKYIKYGGSGIRKMILTKNESTKDLKTNSLPAAPLQAKTEKTEDMKINTFTITQNCDFALFFNLFFG